MFSTFPSGIPSVSAALYNPTSWDHPDFSTEDLAYYWAPIWYQNTGGMGVRDFITRFDFDHNWVGADNWDNIMLQPNNWDLKGYIYYSVVETETHWFIGYYDFHPQDWDSSEYYDSESHENDMEGTLLVIKRPNYGDNQLFGNLEIMVTEAHGDFYQYANLAFNSELGSPYLIMARIKFETASECGYHGRPVLYVQSGGHGLFGSKLDAGMDQAWEYDPTGFTITSDVADWNEADVFPDNDGVIYYPTGKAEYPTVISPGSTIRKAGYQLLDISQLWDLRFQEYNNDGYSAFANFFTLNGNGDAPDSANLPWGWDDNDDSDTFAGEIFYNPAQLISTRFWNLGDFAKDYTYNPYCVQVSIDQLRVNMEGGVYLELYMVDGQGEHHKVLGKEGGSQFNWADPNFPAGTWVTSMPERLTQSFYGIRYPNEVYYGIRVFRYESFMYLTLDNSGNPMPCMWYGPRGANTPVGGNYNKTIYDGQTLFNWDLSEARISVLGDVIDDDISPPVFLDNTFQAYPLPSVGASSNLASIFKISVSDASGIREGFLEYRGPFERNWTKVEANIRPSNVQSQEGSAVSLQCVFDPKDLQRYFGNEITCRFSATDNDFDRLGDGLQSYSAVHHYVLNALMGEKPSAFGTVIAFSTLESQVNTELTRENGHSDYVVQYYNFSEGELHNTRQIGQNVALYDNIIAFDSIDFSPSSIDNTYPYPIGELPVSKIKYYNITTQETKYIADGWYPSIYGDIIAFQGFTGIVTYYNVSARFRYPIETDIEGENVSICKDVIAFVSKDDLIGYYNISSGETKYLTKGFNPSISDYYNENEGLVYYITFENSSGLYYAKLIDQQYPDMVNFHEWGRSPCATHTGTIWFEQPIVKGYPPQPGEHNEPQPPSYYFVGGSEIVSYNIITGEFNNTQLIGQYPSASSENEYYSSNILVACETSEEMRMTDLNTDGDQGDSAVMFLLPYFPSVILPNFTGPYSLMDTIGFALRALEPISVPLIVALSVIVISFTVVLVLRKRRRI